MSATVIDSDGATRMRLLLAHDAANLPTPPALVRGILAAGSLALLYGESNTGKSTLALDIGMTIATGREWCGRQTRKGSVLHVAGEGLHGLSMRLRAYGEQGKSFRRAPYGILHGAVDLLTPADEQELGEVIGELASETGEAVALVILDTLARCAALDENDGGHMRELIAACDRIRLRTGAAVLLIHHTGKDSTRGARGHSSLRAAVDTELLVEGREGTRTLTVTKQRDLPTPAPMAFDLVPVTVGRDAVTGEDQTACVIAHKGDAPRQRREPSGRAQQAILRALRNRQAEAKEMLVWTIADLRKIGRDLGQRKETARDAVDALLTHGFLTATVGGNKLAEGA